MTEPPPGAEQEPARLPDTVALRPCRYGPMTYLRNDRYIGRSLHVYGEFSEGECTLFRRLIGPGAWVVEAGANVGAHTLCLARIVGGAGQVVAFEPQAMIARLLRANVALSGRNNMVVHGAALGAENGCVIMPRLNYAAVDNFGGVCASTDGDGVVAPLLALDGLRLARCDLIKADVEGMEHDVVRGAGHTIATQRPILYLENDRREKSAALIAALLTLDYRLYWHLPRMFNPDNFRRAAHDLFPGIVSVNLLGLPVERDSATLGLAPVTSPGDWWR